MKLQHEESDDHELTSPQSREGHKRPARTLVSTCYPRASLAPTTDPVLFPFLEAADDAAARDRLGELLLGEAAPLARRVIRGHLRGDATSDLEDVHAGVLLSLAEHLRGLRRDAPPPPIQSFGGYVAAVAHNACHAFLRQRAPERARLASRVRYVLTRDPALAFWEGHGREWLCGKASWRDGACDARSGSRLADASRRLGPRPLPELIRSLLEPLQGPARFEDVVEAIVGIEGIADPRPRSVPEHDAGVGGPGREIADRAPSQEQALARRGFLGRLWQEIRQLPNRQRAALLLNLRDADGRGMIALFPLTGTAELVDLAEAVEMSETELRTLWEELPRDDDWIAARLQVTRRQVINLRKCARERLARRMRGAGGW